MPPAASLQLSDRAVAVERDPLAVRRKEWVLAVLGARERPSCELVELAHIEPRAVGPLACINDRSPVRRDRRAARAERPGVDLDQEARGSIAPTRVWVDAPAARARSSHRSHPSAAPTTSVPATASVIVRGDARRGCTIGSRVVRGRLPRLAAGSASDGVARAAANAAAVAKRSAGSFSSARMHRRVHVRPARCAGGA